MKRAFENSCIKGCLVYFIALVVVVVLSAVGLGGLSARLGAQGTGGSSGSSGTNTAKQPAAVSKATSNDIAAANPSAGAPEQQQQSTGKQSVTGKSGGLQIKIGVEQPTPTTQPAQAGLSVEAAAPTPAPAPAAVQPQPQPQPQPQAQVQQAQGAAPGGDITGITGESTPPFYIVQENDTLSQIAERIGVSSVEVQRANNIADANSIWPGQVIYLPSASAPAPASAPPPLPQGGQDQTAPMPAMPNTGINAQP